MLPTPAHTTANPALTFEPTCPFQPVWWCTNTHAQTIAGVIFATTPRLAWQRQRLDTPDGDFLDLDRLPAPQPHSPRLILLHGLESSSRGHEVRNFMAAGQAAGWESIALNFRTCGGEMNRTERAYHSGETGDLAWLIEQLLQEDATRPIVCIGISLGANVLLKYLGEQGKMAPAQLQGAVAISTPFDLNQATIEIERGFNLLYMQRFVLSLKQKAWAKHRRHPDRFNPQVIRAIKKLSEFDEQITAPLHGFASAKDYWTQSSSAQFLTQIRRPTLLISSKDDPFCPGEYLPYAQVANNPFLAALFTEAGGHAAFIDGGYPFRLRCWSHRQAIAFLQHIGQAPSAGQG